MRLLLSQSDLARFERLPKQTRPGREQPGSGFGWRKRTVAALSWLPEWQPGRQAARQPGRQLSLLWPLPIKMRFDGRIINHVSVRISVTGLRFSERLRTELS